MAYVVKYSATYEWIPDGAGSMSVPNAQKLTFFQSGGVYGPIAVAGGDAPTQNQFQTAATAVGTDLSAQITTAITTRLQGFASGLG